MDKYDIVCKRFEADQVGINQLKDRFYNEAKKFVYFRKGEWRGFRASFEFAKNWRQANPTYVSTGLALYSNTNETIAYIAEKISDMEENIDEWSERIRPYFKKPAENFISRRVIFGEGRLTEEEISEWEEICGKGSIAEIPKSQVGKFRYVLNEQRYAIFSRIGKQELRGIIGEDKETILMLRLMFDLEFFEALKAQNKL